MVDLDVVCSEFLDSLLLVEACKAVFSWAEYCGRNVAEVCGICVKNLLL